MTEIKDESDESSKDENESAKYARGEIDSRFEAMQKDLTKMIDGQKTVIETRVKQIISEETGELRKEMQRERVEQVSDGKVF